VIRSKRPPLNCTLCGISMWNDENAVWVPPFGAPTEPEPYCSQGCATLANAEYVWDRQPHGPEAGQ